MIGCGRIQRGERISGRQNVNTPYTRQTQTQRQRRAAWAVASTSVRCARLLEVKKPLCLYSVQYLVPDLFLPANAVGELRSSECQCSELCFSRSLCNSSGTFHLLWYRLIQLSDQLKAFSTPAIISREEALNITIRNLEIHHQNVKSVPPTQLHHHLHCSTRHPSPSLVRPIFDAGLVASEHTTFHVLYDVFWLYLHWSTFILHHFLRVRM
jgi:hypothetical protein